MSAYCNLAGLFPPQGSQVWSETLPWQPIPVHTEPRDIDHVSVQLYLSLFCQLDSEVCVNG